MSFELRQGEVLGIIGRNGAGKSTLLKILSRITEPTSGWAEVAGRVGSLLEVGTGFHPELSGRENIFLNGAILGMPRSDIRRRFDEIVAFAEVEPFLETPVKRYSSGMYTRLAFSVAAHLEPDVLVVDEVLAVGDAAFQRKCLGKMGQVAGEGRTVLFVSHDMRAVTRLCSRAILLHQGQVAFDGSAYDAATRHLHAGLGTTAARDWTRDGSVPGDSVVRLLSARVCRSDGSVAEVVDIREGIVIELDFEVLTAGHTLAANFHFFDEFGTCAFATIERDTEWVRRPRPVGRYRSAVSLPGNLLAEGVLTVGTAVSTLQPPALHAYERDALAFQVVDPVEGDSARGEYTGPMPGVIRPLLDWRVERIGA